ncbi:MAG: hypothetical protein P8Y94_02615, partial [Acidobacteriota bacterium]
RNFVATPPDQRWVASVEKNSVPYSPTRRHAIQRAGKQCPRFDTRYGFSVGDGINTRPAGVIGETMLVQ